MGLRQEETNKAVKYIADAICTSIMLVEFAAFIMIIIAIAPENREFSFFRSIPMFFLLLAFIWSLLYLLDLKFKIESDIHSKIEIRGEGYREFILSSGYLARIALVLYAGIIIFIYFMKPFHP